MRNVLFRAKVMWKEKWVYGVPIKATENDESNMIIVQNIFNCNEYECRGCEFEPVESDTIGQYIGIEDKIGMQIFEGDILETDIKTFNNNYVQLKGEVIFKDGAFGLQTDNTFTPFANFVNTEFRVIGNVIDNKGEFKYGRN